MLLQVRSGPGNNEILGISLTQYSNNPVFHYSNCERSELSSYSCALNPGERVLIEAMGIPNETVIALIREVKGAGGIPIVSIKDNQIIREPCCCLEDDDMRLMADCELYTLRQTDAFIGIRGFMNISELSDIPRKKPESILRHYVKPVHLEQRNEKIKWVALRWPTSCMAQRAGMSTEAFEDFYFDACTIDYPKMEKAMGPLVEAMQRINKVRILGPGDTDLTFSIKGMLSWV